MYTTENVLKKYIRHILLEASKKIRIKPSIDHNDLFVMYLQNMFQGHPNDSLPFINAVYTSTSKRNKLLKRFYELKRLKMSKSQNVYDTFFTYIDKKVFDNDNIFKKEMLGEFFLENEVKPIDLFYFLKKYFIKFKPKRVKGKLKGMESWSPQKVPILRSNSPDFQIEIDINGWNNLKSDFGEDLGDQILDLNNLSNLPDGFEVVHRGV